jgi:glycosyltransferase involved in cell wall biosynthesis
LSTLFIGTYADTKLIEKINKVSSNSAQISIAAIKYSKLISEGLDYNISNNTSLFLVPIGMYPSSSILFFNKKNVGSNNFIPFINVLFLKQICIAIYTLYFIFLWQINNKGKKKVIIFGFLYLPFLLSCIPFRNLKNTKIVSFVPDLPKFEFTYSTNKFSFKKYLIPTYISLTNSIININDYFVFITKFMKDHLPQKPHLIIEGFVDSNLINITELNYVKNKKSIMYAGALFEKFGVKMLIDAFIEIEGDYELWLFGYGDLDYYIVEKSKLDKRIKYFGNVNNETVFEFEKKARILLNPRPVKHEFTKYSFPSKILEYMSSGTPVLTTKLPGITEDYNDKLFFFNNDNFLDFKNTIIKYLNYSDTELSAFGLSARNFVIKEKNNKKQISKLVKELRNLNYLN